ncbi:MAG TPA: protein kinase, partial [Planctomycetota bacterium]
LVDRDGKVKIADFGLAKLVGQPASVTLTNAGQVMGTPHYMAPEQIERPRDVDHRADLFSLGVVFYEMLTGELPLGRFAPPSQRVEIDVRLDQIVLRTLEHERERRYQSAVEVRTDVEAVARGPAAGLEGAVEAALGTVEETVEAAAEKRFYLHLDLAASRPGWLVILLLAWLLVGVAFDLGPLALAGMGCAMLGLFFVLVRWRFGAEAPEATGPRWRQRLQGCVFGGLGLLALLVAHLASFERGTWHYTPRFQRAGEGLDLGWRANDVLLQRVGLTRSGTHTIVEMDSNHWLDHPDALLRVHPALFLGLAVLGLAAAAYGIRGRGLAGLRASLPEASVILGLWFGSLFLLHVATWLYRGFESVKVQLVGVREAHGSADDVAQALYAALIERGFEVQGEHHGRLVDAPSGADLARVVVLKATPGSPFERWELTWRGPRRLQPHLVLRIVSDLAGARAAIEVEGGLVERSGPEEGRWRAWLDELLAEATGG